MSDNPDLQSKRRTDEEKKNLKHIGCEQNPTSNEKPKLTESLKAKVKRWKNAIPITKTMLSSALKNSDTCKDSTQQITDDSKLKTETQTDTTTYSSELLSHSKSEKRRANSTGILNKCKKILKWHRNDMKVWFWKTVDEKCSPQSTTSLSPTKSLNASDGKISPEISKGIIKVEQFSEEAKATMRRWLVHVSEEGVYALRREFYLIGDVNPTKAEAKHCEANPNLCRYSDIKCYDSTRVVLTWPKDCKNDFIHANWVKHKLLSNSFICTQAPQEHTVFDFWRMVWQEKTKLIIMLCKLVEKRRPKCCQYWPGSIGQTMKFDKLSIKSLNIDKTDNSIVITKLQIEYEDESRTVYHQQWASWPDRSVPKTPLAPFRLLKCARQQKTPVIVHCSAGIGRTGTLILVEMMLSSLKKGKVPDAKKYLQIIRNQRARAVQTEDQYIYAHYAIIQMLYIKKVFTVHDVAGFCKSYLNYLIILNEARGKKMPPAEAILSPKSGTTIKNCEADMPKDQKSEINAKQEVLSLEKKQKEFATTDATAAEISSAQDDKTQDSEDENDYFEIQDDIECEYDDDDGDDNDDNDVIKVLMVFIQN